MAKDSKKIPSFTIKSAGITLSCASLILLAVSLVLGIIAVMEALSDGGFENLNQNLSSQNYGTLTEWISLIAPQLVFALTVFWFIKKYNIDSSLSSKLENTTYILHYKNYLYLLIRELLEQGIIVTNKYRLLISKEDVILEDIIDIINDTEFVNKDIKKLELSK